MVVNFKSSNKEFTQGLYIVSTPIGNLEDITLRAINILKNSDYILCEDTRVSQNLFKKYGIDSKLISNHKFNERKNLSKIIKLLKSGSIISLVSDAGTPSISDPGSILIRECVVNDIKIIPIPGPSAVAAAISVSGFSEKFYFYGFLPEKMKILKEDLSKLSQLNSSIVFFISPKKINKIVQYLKNYFSGRKILICREITKFYEEFIRLDIDQLNVFDKEPKGELTVVISEKIEDQKDSQKLNESDKRVIKKMINKFSVKEIINIITLNKKVSKKEIYNYYLLNKK